MPDRRAGPIGALDERPNLLQRLQLPPRAGADAGQPLHAGPRRLEHRADFAGVGARSASGAPCHQRVGLADQRAHQFGDALVDRLDGEPPRHDPRHRSLQPRRPPVPWRWSRTTAAAATIPSCPAGHRSRRGSARTAVRACCRTRAVAATAAPCPSGRRASAGATDTSPALKNSSRRQRAEHQSAEAARPPRPGPTRGRSTAARPIAAMSALYRADAELRARQGASASLSRQNNASTCACVLEVHAPGAAVRTHLDARRPFGTTDAQVALRRQLDLLTDRAGCRTAP